MTALSRDLSALGDQLYVQESVVALTEAKTGGAQQLVAGNAQRWELEIWLVSYSGTSVIYGYLGTDPTKVSGTAGMPVLATGFVGNWNVRQNGVRPQQAWYAAVPGTGATAVYYIVESIARQ